MSASPTPFSMLSAPEVYDLLAIAAHHIHDGVLITDAASRILWANSAYCAMTGHPLESLVGRTPAILRPPEAGASRAREVWDSLGACGRFQGRFVNQRADGSVFHASISIVHIPSRAGDPGFYLCTMQDVSADVELERQLARMTDQAIRARDTTIFALASLAEQRDRDAGAHLSRIEAYATAMAEWLLDHHRERLPELARDAQTIGRCAILHDIGKVGIPNSVLLKRGRLDAAEQEVMRQHPRLGAEILDRVILQQPECAFLRIGRQIVAFHHEAFDGTGYPYGLCGEEIPLVAQVTTVADVLDALTSRRPYKPAHGFESAITWISERRGAQFGPLAVDALLACSERAAAIHAAFGDPPSEHGIAPSGIRSAASRRPAAPAALPARPSRAAGARGGARRGRRERGRRGGGPLRPRGRPDLPVAGPGGLGSRVVGARRARRAPGPRAWAARGRESAA